jgi:anti-sigma B factor antagonist
MSELRSGTDLVPDARQEGDTVIATVRGEIDLHNSPQLRDALLTVLLKPQPRKIVLNLADVPFMDSSAIAVLVETLQRLRKQGGKLYLTNLQPRVRGLLEIAKLDSIFKLVADEQAAMQDERDS